MRYAAWAAFALTLARPAASPAQVVTIQQDFTGSTLTQVAALPGGFTFAPPDSDGTVGTNNFVEFINGAFAVYAKTGNPTNGSSATSLIRVSDAAFWNGIGNDGSYGTVSSSTLSDTRVRFDPNTNRYYAVEITLGTNNRVLIARTEAGADPSVLANWKATSYVGSSGLSVDFPTLGFDANAVYVSTNIPSNGREVMTSIPKTDLTAATPTVANRTSVNTSSGSTGSGFTPQPVVDWSPTKGNGVFIGTVSGSSVLRVTSVTGAGGAGATFSAGTSVTVGTYATQPSFAPQPDGTFQLDNLDSRQGNAAYQVGNDIWTVHSVAGGAAFGNRAVLRWYRIDYTTNAVIASGTLGDTAGQFDYYNASIAANAVGEVVISFTRSGTAATGSAGNAGAYALVGTTTGTVTTFGAPIQLQAGLANNYHLLNRPPPERWGDFSAVSVDPNDTNTFWLINEYVLAGGTSSAVWVDNVTALSVTPVPEPAALALGGAAALAGLAWRRRRAAA
jgi:hypothetical protein